MFSHYPELCWVPRGWLGYFVGCESESIYKIFSPDKHQVFRVGVARIDDGEGLNDPHTLPSLQDRVPTLPQNITVQESESQHSDSDFEDTISQHSFQDNDLNEENNTQREAEVQPSTQAEVNTPSPQGEVSKYLASTAVAQDTQASKPPSESGDDADDDDLPTLPKSKWRRPDDSRCDRCFRYGYRCDRNEVGTPCSRCQTSHMRCADQTPETQAKYIPKHYKDDIKKIATPPEVNPCRRCYQQNRPCRKSQGPNNRCDGCLTRQGRCHTDLTGAKVTIGSRSKKPPGSLPFRKGVQDDQKCMFCKVQERACNGESPCNTCIGNRKCIPQYNAAIVRVTPKCRGCTKRSFCDTARPCQACVRKGKECIYIDQGGLVKRLYHVPHAQTGPYKQRQEVFNISESDEECRSCIRYKRNCNGDKPCYPCVKSNGRRPNDKATISCTFIRKGGIAESYSTRTHQVQHTEDGGVITTLRPDYHKYSYLPTVARPGSGQALTRRKLLPGKTFTGPRHNLPTQVPDESTSSFVSTFPNGYTTILTPGTGLECGLYAVQRSIAAQFPGLPQPSLHDLRSTLQHPELALVSTHAGVTNTSNFSADQLGAILYHWGNGHDLNLSLGYITAQGETLQINTPNSDQADLLTIWIHNDYHSDNLSSGNYNHWSGLQAAYENQGSYKQESTLFLTDSETNVPPQGTKRDITELSDSESSSSLDDTILARRSAMDDDLLDSELPMKKGRHAMLAHLTTSGPIEPQSYAEAMRSPQALLWTKAIQAELQSLKDNATWKIVELPKDRKPLTSRWVFKQKVGADGQVYKHKARLVARGFQQVEGLDYEETFAAVVKADSFRVLFALAAVLGWHIHQMDVKTAFLNGNLEEEVYMKPPPGVTVPRGKVLHLCKALYGLKQAPRAWYDKFRHTMLLSGWRVSSYDPCIFIHDDSHIILALWVDDMLIFGPNMTAINAFKTHISQAFEMTDEGECSYYLGLHVIQQQGEVLIHQGQYAQQVLSRFGFAHTTTSPTPGNSRAVLTQNDTTTATPEFKLNYQSKIGSINFLANNTRPDISFPTGYVARYASNPNQSHMDAVDHICAYVANDPHKGIRYRKSEGINLHGFSDSNHGGEQGKSTGGYIFLIGGGPVAWRSQRQKTVALSTMDAEYIAASEAAKQAIWLKNFINDLQIPECHIDRVPLFIDNNSALKLTKNPEFHSRSKHLDLKYHYIREKVVDTKEIVTQRVDTQNNTADIFTKFLPRATHEKLTEKMGMTT